MGTVTKLEVGADPETVEKCHMLAKRLPELQRDIDTNQKVVDMYSKKLASGDKLKPDKLTLLKQAKIAVTEATNEYKESQEELEVSRQAESDTSAKASISDNIFCIFSIFLR